MYLAFWLSDSKINSIPFQMLLSKKTQQVDSPYRAKLIGGFFFPLFFRDIMLTLKMRELKVHTHNITGEGGFFHETPR